MPLPTNTVLTLEEARQACLRLAFWLGSGIDTRTLCQLDEIIEDLVLEAALHPRPGGRPRSAGDPGGPL